MAIHRSMNGVKLCEGRHINNYCHKIISFIIRFSPRAIRAEVTSSNAIVASQNHYSFGDIGVSFPQPIASSMEHPESLPQ